MGYENENTAPVILDIETLALDEAELTEYLDGLNFYAPGNYKDPEKIAANIAEQRAAKMEEAGLDFDLCRIIAIGVAAPWTPIPYKPFAMMARYPHHEPTMLATLWHAIALRGGGVRPLMTYNGRSFDLPCLMRRSVYCDVSAPALNVDRYRSTHPDVMMKLCGDDVKKARPLKFYVRRNRIQVEEHPECAAITGRDIARLAKEDTTESWALIEGHVIRDVAETIAVARRYNHFPKAKPVVAEPLPL